MGPFQSSLLSLIPKASKPGKYQAVHDFSYPHTPLANTTSINTHIDSNSFPCTWGTFSTVALLISQLPPGSQVSVRDVAEAYMTIPAHPDQWPGMVIWLQSEDKFVVNVCNNFGLASAGGIYGLVANAGADIFRGNGIGPLAKWVDDHIFFRIPRDNVARYNMQCAEWRREIKAQGGCRQEGGRVWYGGKELPSGHPEEFDKDCAMPLQDLADASPRAAEDRLFAYADEDIDQIFQRLGIRWEPSKTVPFGSEVPYLGFCWDLRNRAVHLHKEKKAKYLAAIAEWEQRKKHNLLKVQKLYGKLLHAALVIPAGRAHLTSLEAMLAICNNSPFIPRSPPRDTPSDLEWWKTRLRKPTIRPFPSLNCSSIMKHTQTQARASESQSQLAQDGERGGSLMDGKPKDGTFSGPRQLASNFLSSAFAQYLKKGSTLRSMGTTGELSKDGGKDPVETCQLTRSSAASYSSPKSTSRPSTQDISQVSRTPQMPLRGVTTLPQISYS